jgi:hypothetical protein
MIDRNSRKIRRKCSKQRRDFGDSGIIMLYNDRIRDTMMKPDHIPYLRIFVSSPGDVNNERRIALDVIEQLSYRPAFCDKVAFRVIAWDKPGAGTPMRATLTPIEGF